MLTIVYIHGFNSSSRSFSFVKKELPDHKAVLINYDSHQPLADTLKQVAKAIPKDSEICVIGHSLGGVIGALLLEAHPNIAKLITIGSPLAGVKAAVFAKWIPGLPPIVKDLAPTSHYIRKIKKINSAAQVLSICSTGGHLNTSIEPNDSIVTVSSQKGFATAQKVEIDANHFESLLHESTIDLIQAYIFGDMQ